MPFVRRSGKGEITGHSVTEQFDAKEFLPDDHPEVLEYLAKVPPGFLVAPTEKEIQIATKSSEQAAKDHEKLTKLITAFTLRFSELELALSALLYVVINNPESKVAYAIYYSPTGFVARVELVQNALIEVISENESLSSLESSWRKIRGRIDKSRNLRNAVAHSSQITHNIRGKSYARLSPPAFDAIRVGRMLAKRQIPGLTVNDLKVGCYKLTWAANRVDEVNRLISSFHAKDSLLDRFNELEENLTKSDVS